MTMLQRREGNQSDLSFVSGVDQVMLKYEMPWREVVMDLYDEVKSLSSGYASLEYEDIGFREGSFCLFFFFFFTLKPLITHTRTFTYSKSKTSRYSYQSRTNRCIKSCCVQRQGSSGGTKDLSSSQERSPQTTV
jgi:hypothetical protein